MICYCLIVRGCESDASLSNMGCGFATAAGRISLGGLLGCGLSSRDAGLKSGSGRAAKMLRDCGRPWSLIDPAFRIDVDQIIEGGTGQ